MALPPHRLSQGLQGFTSLILAGELLCFLLPVCADPAPVAHQAHGPEQVPLNHEAAKAPDALLRVDPVQHGVSARSVPNYTFG